MTDLQKSMIKDLDLSGFRYVGRSLDMAVSRSVLVANKIAAVSGRPRLLYYLRSFPASSHGAHQKAGPARVSVIDCLVLGGFNDRMCCLTVCTVHDIDLIGSWVCKVLRSTYCSASLTGYLRGWILSWLCFSTLQLVYSL
jgi:hypothetical protein